MDYKSRILTFDRFAVEYSVYPPCLYMPPHIDKLSRMSLILDGQLNESDGASSISASCGSLVIKPNKTIHENTFGNKPVRLFSISFTDDTLFNEFFNKWQWAKHPKFILLATRFWIEVKNIKSEERLMQSFNTFLMSVKLLAVQSCNNPLPWIKELKDLIEENITDGENINQLSKKLSLNRVYMSRAFKKHYNLSPVDYRTYLKLSSAFLNLSLTQKSLAAIAYDSGFSDQSHMNRAFRQYTGCSPAKFRQLIYWD